MARTIAARSALFACFTGVFAWSGAVADERDAARERVDTLAAEWLEHSVARDPIAASLRGLGGASRWPDPRPATVRASMREDRSMLRALGRVDAALLDPERRRTLALLERELAQRADWYAHERHLLPALHGHGVHAPQAVASELRFTHADDYNAWLARLESLPGWLAATREQLRRGVRRGVLLPRPLARQLPAAVRAQLVDDPRDSPLYTPFASLPDALPESERERLGATAAALIEREIVPAYRDFHAFLVETYLPETPAGVGLGADDGEGDARYAALLAHHTGSDLDADALLERAQAELEREADALAGLLADEFGVDDDALTWLQRQRAPGRAPVVPAAALTDAWRAATRRLDVLLPAEFMPLPRLPYGVAPAFDGPPVRYLPPTFGGRDAGLLLVRADTARPAHEITAGAAAHAMPGLHLRHARVLELESLPRFRRALVVTAFDDGWAAYAVTLAARLGAFTDPNAAAGAHEAALLRAAAAVADIGLHARGWRREQAVEFLLAHSARGEAELIATVDRLIEWPGRAVGYIIGLETIRGLREQAEARLGTAFDPAGFHDALLGAGPLPPPLLETRMDTWLRERAAAPLSTPSSRTDPP